MTWCISARQCEWYAARTKDEKDREFLLRKAKDWTKLAIKKELEVRAAAKPAAWSGSGLLNLAHKM